MKGDFAVGGGESLGKIAGACFVEKLSVEFTHGAKMELFPKRSRNPRAHFFGRGRLLLTNTLGFCSDNLRICAKISKHRFLNKS